MIILILSLHNFEKKAIFKTVTNQTIQVIQEIIELKSEYD